ncbi:hypothetical protein B7463_g549, partial [Scytalidium lignicola]
MGFAHGVVPTGTVKASYTGQVETEHYVCLSAPCQAFTLQSSAGEGIFKLSHLLPNVAFVAFEARGVSKLMEDPSSIMEADSKAIQHADEMPVSETTEKVDRAVLNQRAKQADETDHQEKILSALGLHYKALL